MAGLIACPDADTVTDALNGAARRCKVLNVRHGRGAMRRTPRFGRQVRAGEDERAGQAVRASRDIASALWRKEIARENCHGEPPIGESLQHDPARAARAAALRSI
jgi:hypothetical protein